MTRRRSQPTSIAEFWDAQRQDYAAMRSSRFRRTRTGLALSGAGADFHLRSEADYLRLMEYARDMDRNDTIVGQTITRAVDNIVQDGFTLDVQTGDRDVDRILSERWYRWADDPDQCDLAGERCFVDFEHDLLRSEFVDGDVFALLTGEGSLQAVESHRCRTPARKKDGAVHGVVLDPRTRRPLEYWFTRDDVGLNQSVRLMRDVERYPARDADGHKQVLHLMMPKRPTQTRGVSALAPIFDICGMFEDINFAKMVQQQVVSCFAIFRTRRATPPAPAGALHQSVQSDGTLRTEQGLSPGMEIIGEDGDTLEGFSPNVPNPEFFEHVKLILSLVGVNIGMPLVMVLLDAKETNFSGWRGAIEQAKLGFRRRQRRMISQFHRHVYRWKVRQWIAESAQLRAMIRERTDHFDIFGHQWHPPSWRSIQPVDDATAELMETRNALTSQRRRCAGRGWDWDEVSQEIVEDNAKAIRRARDKARELNADLEDETERVHWRELISLPTPDGVQIALAGPRSPLAGTQEAST